MLTQAGPKLMDFGLARSAGRCRFQVSFGNVQIGRSWFAPDGQSVVYLHARTDGQPVLVRRALSAWQSRGGVADTLFAGCHGGGGVVRDRGGPKTSRGVRDRLALGLTIAEVPGIVPPERSR